MLFFQLFHHLFHTLNMEYPTLQGIIQSGHTATSTRLKMWSLFSPLGPILISTIYLSTYSACQICRYPFFRLFMFFPRYVRRGKRGKSGHLSCMRSTVFPINTFRYLSVFHILKLDSLHSCSSKNLLILKTFSIKKNNFSNFAKMWGKMGL